VVRATFLFTFAAVPLKLLFALALAGRGRCTGCPTRRTQRSVDDRAAGAGARALPIRRPGQRGPPPAYPRHPRGLDDAAAIDGCSQSGIFWRISVPPISPALLESVARPPLT
jgi:hypothetical protein